MQCRKFNSVTERNIFETSKETISMSGDTDIPLLAGPRGS
jgi:hypothetical protein